MPAAASSTRDVKVEAQVFWFQYRKEILAVVVVLLLGGLGAGIYSLYNNREDAAAADLLGSAKTPADYQKVIDQYPTRPAGGSAYLLFAQAERNEHKYADSNTTLQEFIQKQPKSELIPAAHATKAANFESLGHPDDALAEYQAVSNISQSYEAPYALISQVRLLKAKKQYEAARQICETILLQDRESPWAGQAMRELRQLTPKEQPSTSSAPSPAGAAAPPLIARPGAVPAPSNVPPAKPK